MPRIRRWFHVSHDINNDPEVWELTDTFGDWFLRVWLQMLSIGDRNEGYIKGDVRWIIEGLARLWKSDSRRYSTKWRQNRVQMALEWMQNKRWIRMEQDGIYIVNQLKYLSRRVQKKLLRGSTLSSSPLLSSPPSLSSSPVFPDSLKEVPELLKELGIQNGMMDPTYWQKIDSYVDATKLPIFWMDELRKYVMECVETRKAGKRPHKDLKRGFWTWIKRCETWERVNAEKAKFRETRP